MLCGSCAVLQTPSEQERAAPFKPKVALLYTGQNPDLAKTLTQGLVTKPDFGPLELLAAQKYLTAFNSDLPHSPTAVPGELLSLLGFRLGTSSNIQAGLYVEPALIGVSPRDVLTVPQTQHRLTLQWHICTCISK